jgi:hypothetical protein
MVNGLRSVIPPVSLVSAVPWRVREPCTPKRASHPLPSSRQRLGRQRLGRQHLCAELAEPLIVPHLTPQEVIAPCGFAGPGLS